MIFVETSAFVSLLLGEEEAFRIANAISRNERCFTGTHVRLESCMVLSSKLNIEPNAANIRFDKLLQGSSISMLPFTDEIARESVKAFQMFGKGRGRKAKLNLADCLSYAFARVGGMKLLYVGDDFSHTDIRPA